MKALVGLACVAVVAFVSYFFWGEWKKAESARLFSQSMVVRLAPLSQDRDEGMSEDAVLDKIAKVDLNAYDARRRPDVFAALPRETIGGELQRLRIFAAKDAAKFVGCDRVQSSEYSDMTTKMHLTVLVTCMNGASALFTLAGNATPLVAAK